MQYEQRQRKRKAQKIAEDAACVWITDLREPIHIGADAHADKCESAASDIPLLLEKRRFDRVHKSRVDAERRTEVLNLWAHRSVDWQPMRHIPRGHRLTDTFLH